jgi:NAD-dependent deacetylase
LNPERSNAKEHPGSHIPRCIKCGGIIKPDVVLYGEPLDPEVMEGAIEAISNADLLIVGGTSLVVYPAAGLINYFHGNNLVLINKSETPYDDRANLVIHDAIGEVLG